MQKDEKHYLQGTPQIGIVLEFERWPISPSNFHRSDHQQKEGGKYVVYCRHFPVRLNICLFDR